MDKNKREQLKKSLKVIQGGKPSKKEIKEKVTKQFEELKIELAKVKDYKYSRIEEIKKEVIEYEKQYGLYLENINLEDGETLEQLNKNIEKMLNSVKEAKRMKRNEAKAKQKKLGFEIVD